MRNNLYICSAKQQRDLLGTHTNIAYCVSSCGTSAPSSRGCLATISRRVRSLFVHTKRKTCFTMPNNNKQATKAKYSNLFRNIILGTIITVSFFLLYNEYFDGWAFLLEKAIGAILLYLGGKLFYRWNGYDLSMYRNEFRNYGNE